MNTKKAVKVSLDEILYYIFFSLLLFAKGIGLYDGQKAFKILLVLAVLTWAGKMWLTKYTKKELLLVGLLLMLGVTVYLVSGEKGALLYIFMVTGLKNVSLRRVFTVGAVVWMLSFAGMTGLHALHILEGPFKVHEKLGLGMIIRWGLGYSHPNVLHVSYLVLVMFLVYLMKDHFNLKAAFGLMLGNIVIYVYSVSSTGVIAVTFYLMLCVYWMYRGKLNVAEGILIQLVLPFCVLFSLLAPLLLKGKWFDIVNNIVNTRLNLAKHFLSLKPPTLFGVRLSEIVTSQLTMDNSYVFAFVTYGVVLFAVIVSGYGILVHKYCKEQKDGELCLILACFVAGVTEPFLFNTSFKNISLLFMKDIIFEEEKTAVICLPGYFQKEYTLSCERVLGMVKTLQEVWKKKNKLILTVGIIGLFVGGMAYQMTAKEPSRILVPESQCDVGVIKRTEESLETVYLSSGDAAPEQTDRVVGYIDEKERMIIYSGGIVQMEHIRGVLCSGIVAGAALIIVIILASLYCQTTLTKASQGEKHEKNSDCK